MQPLEWYINSILKPLQSTNYVKFKFTVKLKDIVKFYIQYADMTCRKGGTGSEEP
jgi:hypothetical protein